MIRLIVVLIVYLLIILPLTILFAVVSEYALGSWALYRVAKQTGACKPAHAWIPVYRYWVMGRCAEEIDAQSGVVHTKKAWKWSKLLLYMRIAHLGAVIFIMPVGFILALFGLGIVLQAVSWLGIVLTVLNAVCAYKVYRYYLEDPYDILVTVVTVMYPGWQNTALLVSTFIGPRKQKECAVNATYEESGTEKCE